MTNSARQSLIPPRKEGIQKRDRSFQMRLSSHDFILLEEESAKRGTTSYKLGRAVLESWLSTIRAHEASRDA